MSGPFVVLFAVLCTVLVFGNRVCCNDTSGTNNFFLKTARGRVIPRISGRDANNRGMNPLERIFLKASKSIPRIGRTQQSAMEELHKQEILFLPYFNPQDEYQNKMLEYPIWSEVEKKYKYSPTLLPSKQDEKTSEENGGTFDEEIENYSVTNEQ